MHLRAAMRNIDIPTINSIIIRNTFRLSTNNLKINFFIYYLILNFLI